jgi:hypothetical protein
MCGQFFGVIVRIIFSSNGFSGRFCEFLNFSQKWNWEFLWFWSIVLGRFLVKFFKNICV